MELPMGFIELHAAHDHSAEYFATAYIRAFGPSSQKNSKSWIDIGEENEVEWTVIEDCAEIAAKILADKAYTECGAKEE